MELSKATQSMFILMKSDRACDFSTGQLNSLFVAQVDTNGTGLSEKFGLLQPYGITNAASLCAKGDRPPNANSSNTFVQVTHVTGSCHKTLVPEYSVATYPSPTNHTSKLTCNNSLNLDQANNTTAYTRIVADLCPGCDADFGNTHGHIDSYTGNPSCDARPKSNGTITDLGKFYTSTLK